MNWKTVINNRFRLCILLSLILFSLNACNNQSGVTSKVGCPIPDIPLDEPNMSNISLLVWANEAAIAPYTFSYANYPKESQQAAEYFTPEGWKLFQKSFQEAGDLKEILAQKMVVSAVATGSPIMLEQGIIDHKYTWKVQMPMLITYQSASTTKQVNTVVTTLIVRTNNYQGKRGLGVTQYILKNTPKT